MKTKLSWIGLLALSLLSACGTRHTQHQCQIHELLLGDEDVPEGTILNDPYSPVDGYPAQSANISGTYLDGHFYQVVARYASAARAGREYLDDLRMHSQEDTLENPWRTPIEISFNSPLAQEYYIRCGYLTQGHQCRLFAQYNEYYVFLYAYVSDNRTGLMSFEDLLINVDARMAACSRQ